MIDGVRCEATKIFLVVITNLNHSFDRRRHFLVLGNGDVYKGTIRSGNKKTIVWLFFDNIE